MFLIRERGVTLTIPAKIPVGHKDLPCQKSLWGLGVSYMGMASMVCHGCDDDDGDDDDDDDDADGNAYYGHDHYHRHHQHAPVKKTCMLL